MEYKKILVSLVVALALIALFAVNVSALGSITQIEVNGVEMLGGPSSIAAFAGETLPVRVTFIGDADASDTRVKVWIAGAKDYSAVDRRIKVFNGSTYSSLFAVQVPFDIDPKEGLTLWVAIESKNDGSSVPIPIKLAAQRESYIVEILDVDMPSQAKAGETFALDIVLKNRGIEFAEDTFVKARIPALGIEKKAYFEDLSPEDEPVLTGSQDRLDKEDTGERRIFLAIPANAKAGVYTVEIEAYNGDSSTTLTKRIAISGAAADSNVMSSLTGRTFAVGEKAVYSLTLVNAGNKVKVYDLTAQTPENLNVQVKEPVVVVPAGNSRTVELEASASKTGKYPFTVDVSSDGDLVKTQEFTANVEGTNEGTAGNTTVLLTVVLAIIFVVLLVVLIVLLTRKPEKAKEFGESYY